MTRFPMMPLFVDDLIGGTAHMSAAEFGAYLRLLVMAWGSDDGTIPNDDKILVRVTRFGNRNWARGKAVILAKFIEIPDNRLYNRRLMDERRKLNRKTTSTVPPLGCPLKESKNPNKNSLGAAQHSRARARLPEPKKDSFYDLTTVGATPPATLKGAASPSEKPKSSREHGSNPRAMGTNPRAIDAKRRQRIDPLLHTNGFPSAPRAINSASLSPAELATKEAEALAFIEAMIRKDG